MKLVNKNILEKLDIISNYIYINHPITGDIIKVKILKKSITDYTVAVLDDSPYYGQAPFKIKKIKILGNA